MKLPNGYVIHEDRIRVVIAVGFKRRSKNRKTGNMVQIFILRRDIDPLMAIQTGRDRAICGNCPLRKSPKGKKRRCYVVIKDAPLAIYKAYRRGSYPRILDFGIFESRPVRIGAYGDPCFVPFPILAKIVALAGEWTGYTHQWRNPVYAAYKGLLMASVEDASGKAEANANGWRTFRITTDPTDALENEILCPNRSRGVQCVDCGLCKGAAIKAKNIRELAHGYGKAGFTQN